MLRFSPKPNLAHLIPWAEWEDDAFRRAQAENKPVMLWLGAFWCGYCQRMDQETFSDRENLALLSAYFVPLRIEYAKRPDIDARYNLNGWPTVAFFTPQGQLLAAVNYLPVEEFKNLLIDVHLAYQQRQSEFPAAAESPIEDKSPAVPVIETNRLATALDEITTAIMAQADRENGGYGRGQKFIQADANEFLLARYEATKDARFLDHVCLTLDRMRAGPIHDHEEGGYFRTTTGADWSRPHREKLLAEQAGLALNCSHVFRITQQPVYRDMAAEILGYVKRKLLDPSTGAFFGCEDFLRTFAGDQSANDAFTTVIDRCIYTDANTLAIRAYLEASALSRDAEYRSIALGALDFLWNHCRHEDGGMSHYFEGCPQLHGLLNDQVRTGLALLSAHAATGEASFLVRAQELAEFVLTRLRNPAGGFFDIGAAGSPLARLPLTLIEQNGVASTFFVSLGEATRDARYREAALSVFGPFVENAVQYGIHAATMGAAMSSWIA
jgi:uncharacterized protein YyaL (SSP411 family)